MRLAVVLIGAAALILLSRGNQAQAQQTEVAPHQATDANKGLVVANYFRDMHIFDNYLFVCLQQFVINGIMAANANISPKTFNIVNNAATSNQNLEDVPQYGSPTQCQ